MDFRNFSGSYTSAQRALVQVVEAEPNLRDFLKELDVAYKQHDKIAKVKYGISCKFRAPITFACRGSIILPNREIVFALNKFFNCHEIVNRFGPDVLKSLEQQGFRLLYVPKWDGSNIQVFFDRESNLHIYTLGCLDPDITMGKSSAPTYYNTTSELLDSKFPALMEYLKLHPLVSVVCELMTKWNKVITTYTSDFIVPLVVIDSGLPSWDILSKYAPEYFANSQPRHSWEFTSATCHQQFETACSALLANSAHFGENPEGVVGYAFKQVGDVHEGKVLTKGFCLPFEKRKRSEYLASHGNLGVQPGSPKDLCNLQVLVLTHLSDDFAGNPVQQAHILEFKHALASFCLERASQFEQLKDALGDKREFAKIVNQFPAGLRKVMFLTKPAHMDTMAFDFVCHLLMCEVRPCVTCISCLQKDHGPKWFEAQLK
jgi:hypothetical protein